jgi:hypothetical protein
LKRRLILQISGNRENIEIIIKYFEENKSFGSKMILELEVIRKINPEKEFFN